MGAFQKPKYRETAADKAVREDIERRRQEELEAQAELERKEKRAKKRNFLLKQLRKLKIENDEI